MDDSESLEFLSLGLLIFAMFILIVLAMINGILNNMYV